MNLTQPNTTHQEWERERERGSNTTQKVQPHQTSLSQTLALLPLHWTYPNMSCRTPTREYAQCTYSTDASPNELHVYSGANFHAKHDPKYSSTRFYIALKDRLYFMPWPLFFHRTSGKSRFDGAIWRNNQQQPHTRAFYDTPNSCPKYAWALSYGYVPRKKKKKNLMLNTSLWVWPFPFSITKGKLDRKDECKYKSGSTTT